MRVDRKLIFAGALLAGILVAFILPGSLVFTSDEKTPSTASSDGATKWACPMFCVVMDEKSSKGCPVCGMELGPVAAGSRLSHDERAMIGLEAARLEEPVSYTHLTLPTKCWV